MASYALNAQKKLIFAKNAPEKGRYYCIECSCEMRLRKGLSRQRHFYHLQERKNCRQSGKSLRHQHIQASLCAEIPELKMERPFAEIQRIADLAWESRRIVFEIQCSKISEKEVLQRNLDYQKIGYHCIWIFDEHRFNRKRLSAAEKGLERFAHYYAKIPPGFTKARIYDQFEIFTKGFRKFRSKALFLDFSVAPQELNKAPSNNPRFKTLAKQRKQWKFLFKGDLLERLYFTNKNAAFHEFIQKSLQREKKFQAIARIRRLKRALLTPLIFFKRLYEEFFT